VHGPDETEIRVLGSLIEKQRATPDSYPLSLNALRLATNQATGREPVVDYDDAVIRDAIARLFDAAGRAWQAVPAAAPRSTAISLTTRCHSAAPSSRCSPC